MTKEEGRQFKERWQLVNDFINEEIRRTPLSVRLKQFAALFQFAREMDWEEELRHGEAEVQARWQRLQETYGPKA